jgi:murein DD-endopeptidase MepM/ murein hydrolase activator NlpD
VLKRFVFLVCIATLGTWVGVNPTWASEVVRQADPNVPDTTPTTTTPTVPTPSTHEAVTDPNAPTTIPTSTLPPTPLDGLAPDSEPVPERYPPASVSAPRPTKAIQTELDKVTAAAYSIQANALAAQSVTRGLLTQRNLIEQDVKAIDQTVSELRDKLSQQAIAWYVYDPTYASAELAKLESLAEQQQAARIEQITASSLESERAALTDFERSKSALDAQSTALSSLVNTNDAKLAENQSVATQQVERVGALRAELAAAQEGYALQTDAFVFPAAAPYSYWDSWHADRMVGTDSYHLHVGTDILGDWWTPLLAVESGTVGKLGTNSLGGNRIWLYGDSGTDYYYAHLVDWPKDLKEGDRVEPGDVIGYMGDTGNSVGGPVHLHFEIHPNGGDPVNPFPVLAAAELTRRPPHWTGPALP